MSAWAGLDRDALHVVAAIPILLLAALIVRRPLSSVLPWLTVLVLCVADELVSGSRPGGSLPASLRDIMLVMTMPTVLLILTRYLPALMVPHTRSLRILLPLRGQPPAPKPAIVDAEYEEVSQEETVPAAAARS